MSKVARVTAAFWVMKVCATTLGETAGDLLSMTLDVGYATSSVVLLCVFLGTLIAQLSVRAFQPWLYWAVVLSTSTAGTTISDYMDRTLGLGYARGALILATGLAVVLTSWRIVEGALSVDEIETRRAELFYWIAILFSNTLGTALGDYLADDSGLGFVGGAVLIGGLLVLVLAAAFLTRIDRVLLFWIAFVSTRPFGATFGDLLTKDPDQGGLGFGTIGSSLVLAAILVSVIAVTGRRDRGGARSG